MRLAALCSITVSLLSTAVFAQAREPSAGVPRPVDSFALGDDGSALFGNPGGLGFAEGLELDYLHGGYYKSGYGKGDALGLTAGLGPLTLAAGVDFLQYGAPCSFTTPCARRTSLGLGLHAGGVALGLVHRAFSSGDSRDLDELGTWDLGAVVRPERWLSLGLAALDLNRATYGLHDLPRRYQASVGVRPFEALTLAFDARYRECADGGALPCGGKHGDYLATVEARVASGLRLLGQLGFLDGSRTSGQVGLQVDLPDVGLRYAPRFEDGAPVQSNFLVRLSSQRRQSLAVPFKHAALIDLGRALDRPKTSPLALVFGQSGRDPLAQTLAAFHRLARDGSVSAVVLRSGELSIGAGKAEELRAGIEAMQAAGKKVVFYLESGGDLEYSVASSADRIFAAPQAALLVNGFAATSTFAGAGLDKLGVKAEFFRVGAYKNAPDFFTKSSMSGEQREVQNALLDDLYGRYVRQVSGKRHLDEGRLKALLDKGILKPQEAKDAGLLDGLIYPDQLEEETGKLLGGKVSLEKTAIEEPSVRDERWGPAPRIAVVRVEGDILRGEGQRTPFGAVEIAGSDPIIRRIRAAADDPSVAAIVVRIDSPGGDGNASDLIWRELERARKEKKKPVIASMGDVAASGGYYVAAGADEIWAEPSTVTGSIGVFVGHFDAEELWSKLGITRTTLRRGESADLFSPDRDLNDTERKTLQAWVDNFYDQFVERVAFARKLGKPEVDQIARGRVWSGAQALERKLVDHLGGLSDALLAAKARAGLDAGAAVEIDDSFHDDVALQDLAGVSVLTALPVPAGLARSAARALSLLGEPGTVRAALPYDLEVR